MNNTPILQKIVDELKKETPNLQYVIGVIETLVALDISNVRIPTKNIGQVNGETKQEEPATSGYGTEIGRIGSIN